MHKTQSSKTIFWSYPQKTAKCSPKNRIIFSTIDKTAGGYHQRNCVFCLLFMRDCLKCGSRVASREMRVAGERCGCESRDEECDHKCRMRSLNVDHQSYRSLSSPLARELNICPGSMAFLLKLLPLTGAFYIFLS